MHHLHLPCFQPATLVHFAPSWHNSRDLFADPHEASHQLANFLSRHQNPPPFVPVPRDTHLTQSQRISPQCPALPSSLPRNPTHRAPTFFHSSDHWPGEDRPPTGHLQLYALPDEHISDWILCDAGGHPLGYGSYGCLSRASSPPCISAPESDPSQVPQSRLAAAFHRYRPQSLDNTSRPSTSFPRAYWGQLAPPLIDALSSSIAYTAHHLATPLSYLASSTAFTTPFREDSSLGSSGFSYDFQWSGTSLVTPPPYASAITKAFRWALATCFLDPQAVIYLSLPRYHSLYAIPQVTVEEVAYIPKCFRPYCLPPSYGMQQRALSHPDFDCSLVRLHHTSQSPSSVPPATSIRRAISRALPPAGPSLPSSLSRSHWVTALRSPFFLPAKISACPPFRASPQALLPAPDTPLPPAPPPVSPPAQSFYTDGCKKLVDTEEGPVQRCGACVYDLSLDCKHLVQPGAHTGFHATVNRAELSAIFATLTLYSSRNQDLLLYTDSLTSLQQTCKYVSDPRPHLPHPENRLLHTIFECLASRSGLGLTTSLCKVRAHVGIRGNELADEGANEAADTGMGDVVSVGTSDLPADFWIGMHPNPPSPPLGTSPGHMAGLNRAPPSAAPRHGTGRHTLRPEPHN